MDRERPRLRPVSEPFLLPGSHIAFASIPHAPALFVRKLAGEHGSNNRLAADALLSAYLVHRKPARLAAICLNYGTHR